MKRKIWEMTGKKRAVLPIIAALSMLFTCHTILFVSESLEADFVLIVSNVILLAALMIYGEEEDDDELTEEASDKNDARIGNNGTADTDNRQGDKRDARMGD